MSLNLDLDGAPPGGYVVQYTLDDIASAKSGQLSLPFTIAGP
jgi:hypothetical protein